MNINWTNNYKLALELTILILPKKMVATVKESCTRQIGTTVKYTIHAIYDRWPNKNKTCELKNAKWTI